MLLCIYRVSIDQGSIVAITPDVQPTDLTPLARELKTRLSLPDPLPNVEAALRDAVRKLGTSGLDLAWRDGEGAIRRYDESDPGLYGGVGVPIERRHQTLSITVVSPRWRART